jgi:hypothetical protein
VRSTQQFGDAYPVRPGGMGAAACAAGGLTGSFLLPPPTRHLPHPLGNLFRHFKRESNPERVCGLAVGRRSLAAVLPWQGPFC